MRSKLKLSRSLEFISAFFKEQQVINTRGGANLAPPPVLIGLTYSPKKNKIDHHLDESNAYDE